MKSKNLISLLTAIGICEGVGIAGGICTAQSVSTWYQTLNKPSFNPPGWIFAPVWTTLYAMMGLACFLIYQKKETKGAPAALFIFSVQLALNLLWSVLFFCMKTPAGALIEIIFLWAAILLTTILFWKISKRSAILLLPYLLWVSFASVLNFEIWRLNR
jgi:tryptophan-rich sensory protein